jgi:cytochrome P450|tara:strand:- start:28 stop:1302 length:1275 start_codon:yes stop_codon:yes gene_type:complete
MSKEIENIQQCPIHEINPMHPDLLRCPALLNKRLRDEAPVFKDPSSGIYFISRFEDVVAMSQDPKIFSSVMGGAATRAVESSEPEIVEIMAEGYADVPTMLTQDPPLQRRYRKFVDGVFAPSALNALSPMMESISHDLIDRFGKKGECEFLSEFGIPLPLTVIASQIGAPIEDLPKLRRWTEAFIDNLSQQGGLEGRIKTAKSIIEFQHYFISRLEERRAEPRDDILSKIVNASIEGDQPMNNGECLSMLNQILVAGNETTGAAMAQGILLLIENPDQYELVLADPSLQTISNFVEEVLRVSSPSANMYRRTTKDIELHGVSIPENSICFARFASANQDDNQFQDALRFDITRHNLKTHVAFGKGVHHCLGAALARREMNIGFKVLFARVENFRLQSKNQIPEFMPNALLHGLERLDIAFDIRR